MPLVKPVVKIENVVATAALKHGIDLSAVVKAFPMVDYRPERFPGLVFKLKKPRTTILIFGTGKISPTFGSRIALVWGLGLGITLSLTSK